MNLTRIAIVIFGFIIFGSMFFLWPKTALLTTAFMSFFIALRIAVTYREHYAGDDFLKMTVYSLISAFSLRSAILLFMV